MIYQLENQIKDYAWGSYTAMGELFDLPNTDNQPQAEMWLGAHSAGCSYIITANGKENLATRIASNPEKILGKNTAEHFSHLPFLLKILSAAMPLSIQVHPNKQSAERGFVRENQAGIPLNAPHRNYKDDNHKPELIYALTEFQALNGFREINEIISLFQLANITSLQQPIALLKNQPNSAGLKQFFTTVMELEESTKKQAIGELLDNIDNKGNTDSQAVFALIQKLNELYPNDVGLFAPLLLNIITLQPHEAMFLYAETPHAYIEGTGIEIMANSDNVLRAGLTPKHIDTNELLANVKYAPKPFATLKLNPKTIGSGHKTFPVPVNDFAFDIIEIAQQDDTKPITVTSAEIVLCLNGKITLSTTDTDKQQSITIKKGQSVFIPADTQEYILHGIGNMVRAYSGV